MTSGGGGGPESPVDGTEPETCEEPGCQEPAAVRLHVPWAEDRSLCPAHARPLASRDGVVAEPIEGAEAEWP